MKDRDWRRKLHLTTPQTALLTKLSELTVYRPNGGEISTGYSLERLGLAQKQGFAMLITEEGLRHYRESVK